MCRRKYPTKSTSNSTRVLVSPPTYIIRKVPEPRDRELKCCYHASLVATHARGSTKTDLPALDPEAQAVLDALGSSERTEISDLTPMQVREQSAARLRDRGPEQVRIEDSEIRGPGGQAMALRFYYPPTQQSTWLPALVYFHGGGFVSGSIESSDGICRMLCARAQCCVVSVAYRLAPEAKFPAAVLDAYTALSYVHENADEHGIDHHKIAVGGDSAGANLATVVARQTKERRGPDLSLQLLFYPVADLRALDTASYNLFEYGPYLTRASMAWHRDHYLPDIASRQDPAASPLAAKNLIGMPPALVITAECDPLRDEGEAYANALREAGTSVALHRYSGQFHGFVGFFGQLSAAKAALDEAADHLRSAF